METTGIIIISAVAIVMAMLVIWIGFQITKKGIFINKQIKIKNIKVVQLTFFTVWAIGVVIAMIANFQPHQITLLASILLGRIFCKLYHENKLH